MNLNYFEFIAIQFIQLPVRTAQIKAVLLWISARLMFALFSTSNFTAFGCSEWKKINLHSVTI